MTINELNIAIFGIATTVSGIVSYYFGAKKNKADAYETIIKTFDFALESLRKEMKASKEAWEIRFSDLEKKAQFFREKACTKEGCAERIDYN